MISASPLEQVRAASARLSKAAEDAIANMGGHDLAHSSWQLMSGETQNFPLISGAWVDYFPGIRLNLIDDDTHSGGCPAALKCDTASRVLMEAKGKVALPAHSHDFHETVHVIHGSIQDLLDPQTSLRRRTSDILYWEAGQMHQPVCEGLFLVCWSPPLLRIPIPSL